MSPSRLVVRPFRKTDYRAWREAERGRLPKQHRFDHAPRPEEKLTRSAYEQWISRDAKLSKLDRLYKFGAFLRGSGKLIGTTDLLVIQRLSSQWANLGYSVYNQHWRRGYGREMVEATIEIAFRKLKLHRLEAAIEPGNRASLALARSLDLRHEGRRRGFLWVEGKWHDLIVYSVCSEDRGISCKPCVRVSLFD